MTRPAKQHRQPSPEVNSTTSQVEQFFAAVFEPSDLIELRMFPISSNKALNPEQRWCRATKICEAIQVLIELNNQGHNVYVGANPRITKGGKAKDVRLARCLFVDFDNDTSADQALWAVRDSDLPAPSAVVNSGHGVHVWWRLDEPIHDLEQWSAQQKALIALLGTDTVVFDPPRVMRLPGFLNHKPPPADVVLVQAYANRTYPIGEFPSGELRQPRSNTSEKSKKSKNSDEASKTTRNSVIPRNTMTSLMQRPDVWTAITMTLPDGPDQRRRKVFKLAKILKGLPGLENVIPYELEPIIREWHRRASPHINHKAFEITLADFCSGWDHVKYPGMSGPLGDIYERSLSNGPPPEAMRFPTDCPRQLAALCRELQRDAGDGPFWIDERTAGILLSVNQSTINYWFKEFRKLKMVERTEKGTRGRASRYRYLLAIEN